MNYELAKKLESAGWKFRELVVDEYIAVDKEDGGWLAPLLSELIEACDKLVEDVVFLQGHKEQWLAVDGRDGFGIYGGDGKSPEEALATLWLQLKSKKNETI